MAPDECRRPFDLDLRDYAITCKLLEELLHEERRACDELRRKITALEAENERLAIDLKMTRG